MTLRAIRQISVICFLLVLCGWILATLILLRSKFRSDVFTFVTSGHQCLTLAWDQGNLELEYQAPWPGMRLIAWSSAPAHYNTSDIMSVWELRGPKLTFSDTSHMKSGAWKNFSIAYGLIDQVYDDTDQYMIYRPWRYFIADESSTTVKTFRQYCVAIPLWAIPTAIGILPVLWISTAGRRRWREQRRRENRICTQCGYDLRETPNRCPECGLVTSENRHRPDEWKNASLSLAAMMLILLAILRWETSRWGAPVVADSPRTPSVDPGIYYHWTFDEKRAAVADFDSAQFGKYTVRVDGPHTDYGTGYCDMCVLNGQQVIHKWANRGSFVISNDVLYRVICGTPGGTVVAVDLHTGQELWKSEIVNCVPTWVAMEHMTDFGFPMRVMLEIRDERLLVFADERYSRYMEAKDLRTGKTIGHHIYETPSPFIPPTINLGDAQPDHVDKGKSYELHLLPVYPMHELETVDRWTVDWNDGPDGGSDIISYTYPANSDRMSPLVVQHVFTPGTSAVVVAVTAEIHGQTIGPETKTVYVDEE